MKNLFERIPLTAFFLFAFIQFSKGQERIVQKACFDSSLQRQSDSIKADLAGKGFIVVKEATMTMESAYEMPIIVPLTQGTWYQVVFLGDPKSKLYEVRMYDQEERQVVYRKNGIESNFIMYPYIPKATEYYVIKPVQIADKKKQKQLCGYVIMFKKVK